MSFSVMAQCGSANGEMFLSLWTKHLSHIEAAKSALRLQMVSRHDVLVVVKTKNRMVRVGYGLDNQYRRLKYHEILLLAERLFVRKLS